MSLEVALTYALEADPQKRSDGEHQLMLGESTPGFVMALAHFAVDQSKASGTRQLAALRAQRLIKAASHPPNESGLVQVRPTRRRW